MTFEQKVRSMTFKEIVGAMIAGLKAEHVKVDMSTYGDVKNGICYGCAATNCIAEISGATFTPQNIKDRGNIVPDSVRFIFWFEIAIDTLRRGCFCSYNTVAQDLSIAESPFEEDDNQYYLGISDWREVLPVWEKLYESL